MRGDRLLAEVSRLVWGRALLIVLVTALAAAASLLLPNALAVGVDAAIAGRTDPLKVVWVLSLGATEILAEVLGGVLTISATSTSTAWLRRRLADRLLALGLRSPFAEGDALSRLTGDCYSAGAIVSILVQLGSSVVISTGAIVLLAVLDWRLALVFLASVPLALLTARSHLRHTADDVLTYQQVSGELSARLLDAVRGLRTIAASGTADREAERVLRPLPRLGGAGSGMWRTQARMVWRASLLLPAVELAVLLAAGFGVLAGRLTIGDVLAALGYVALGMSLVRQIPLLTTLSRARSCARRIDEVLSEPAPRPGSVTVARGTGRIEFDGFEIPGGAFVAVVGRSGSGKSRLVAKLGGLEPDGVRLDGCPTGSIRPEDLRALVGYAFDRPALIGDTVTDAVVFGSWAGRGAVREACREAQVHDLIVRLPEGYDTPLAEAPLSGGEAQRLGLARALVRRPRVLVLDDATASLDTVTESLVDSAIAAHGSTRIVVTRRPAAAARADVVLWLENGRVRAAARHDVLWQDPDYRAVFTEEAG
ncbi:ABC transporter ATP-binding protein/permease [Amycolatopsis acidiphila]|uniref:ABC transporter ATP-binding protein n=1 Tax=Amycolatopsis acidiphila TaxID=715473 RepID=A0A558AEF2_9PSEU|nr:ABC transporter ATP-binding protein [Amycolatopsis acidiphila]TVT22648.1 ABC transporter ATP-binding protein [Amycolatopsis acidiphila]UIJ59592.1 ABC transporter ATP-binding protein/permease [Amycolatopsis acidiphila]GHG80802.1 ABC transporter ATP-binding protein [Amycolatopsis acidiphila]